MNARDLFRQAQYASMLEERHRLEADKFFRLVEKRFNRLQLVRYVEMKTGETLGATDVAALLGYAIAAYGAKRDPKALAPVYELPAKPRRQEDTQTLELFQ